MSETREIETPVLIAGGGPVGMALALLLGRFGIDNVIVERSRSTTEHPKARGLTGRSMEILRLLGVEDEVRAGGLRSDVSPEAASLAWTQVYCESGVGRVIGSVTPEPALNSPSPKCCVAQDVVEQALDRALADSGHTTFLRGVELAEFDNGPDGVEAVVRGVADSSEIRVRARYMAGCDGIDSQVRAALGIGTEGPGVLHQMASYFYRADLSHLPHAGRYQSLWIVPRDPEIPSGPILATDPGGQRWLFVHYLTDDEQPLTDEQVVSVVRAHWGIPDLDVEIINMMRWRMQARLADDFRGGSVFLVGDAAHAIPPTGGIGLNSGFQDAHNLAWKLAFVLDGAAHEDLLTTYTTERRAFGAEAIAWSTRNRELQLKAAAAAGRHEEDPDAWRDALREVHRSFRSEGLAMGYAYERGALIDDGEPRREFDPEQYEPSDRPGARFPHIWLDGGRTESAIDWFGRDLVLVCGPDADGWRTAGAAARDEGLPVDVKTLPWMAGDITFESDGAVLVRPDGHVAWRPGRSDAAAFEELPGVLRKLLGNGTYVAT